MKNKRRPREVVCCAGCGRDTTRRVGDVRDAYCARCIGHGRTHQFPETADRPSLGPDEWFADPLWCGQIGEDEFEDLDSENA